MLPAADVVHGTYGVLPRCGRTPYVLTVHDLTFMHVPGFHVASFAAYLRAAVPRAARHARLVMADSQATARDLERLCHVPAERIRVVYLGYDPERFHRVAEPGAEAVLARYGVAKPYVLFVGTLEPRKNVVRLLDAFATLRAQGAPHRLVLAGEPGWGVEPMLARLAAPDLAGAVVRPGRVAERDLPTLYREADAFAYPSFYEGFGLPVVEAMACGTPVVTSDASSLPEVAGDAALLVPPEDTAALAAALGRLLGDTALRARLAAEGPRQAARFTWRATARATLAVYREAVG
jgi:glycosyltransferase involved in cell wall biosynthesis